ncbi:patatin-like phospholipase family protein [Marinomonas agarivorans]|nr:patatin-like phospholipase family protein [Marinomonas agarivorans]
MRNDNRIALILSGGGARAAYQVGVLSAIGKMLPKNTPLPFPILCGTSAGALNAGMLAIYADNFTKAISNLSYVWRHLTPERVYKTNSLAILSSIGKVALSLFHDGYNKNSQLSLLDNAPLHQLLRQHLDLNRIQTSIDKQYLDALSITAMSYTTGLTTSFFEGQSNIENWERTRQRGIRTKLTHDHLLASSAIPIIFPARQLGDDFYGDGAMRQQSPISPALHLGADKIMVIGVSDKRAITPWHKEKIVAHSPSIAQITGQLLHSAFIDNFETDIEQLKRTNSLSDHSSTTTEGQKISKIETLIISPSMALDEIGSQHLSQLPWNIRSLLGATGATPKAGGTTAASYLLFTSDYCRSLIELGKKDANWEKDRILDFLNL